MFTCLISAAAALFGAAAAAAALLLRQKLASGKRTPDAPPQWPPTEWDRRFMAFHEAGHAVASRHLPGRPPLLRVTISPSDEAFGMIRTEENPHHNETRQSLASTLAVLLAGRIAEERFLHEITTSCVHDLSAAKQLAADMVLKLGMGESSGLTLPPDELAAGETARRIGADIQKLLADAVRSATDVLNSHAGEVTALAEQLLRDETLDREGIESFFGSYFPISQGNNPIASGDSRTGSSVRADAAGWRFRTDLRGGAVRSRSDT